MFDILAGKENGLPCSMLLSLKWVGQEAKLFLMLFFVMTLSIGIFNANAARTLNTNYEEKSAMKMGQTLSLRLTGLTLHRRFCQWWTGLVLL